MPCKICGQATIKKWEDLYDDRYGYPGLFSISECSACGFAQTEPPLPAEKFSELYTNYYPRRNFTKEQVQAKAKYQPRAAIKIKEWLKGTNNICHHHIKPATKVLDIGCGDGASLLEIKAQGAEAYGTEEDRNIEPIAKQLGLQIYFGPLTQATYPNDSFDYITLSQVLEHVSNPQQYLSLIQQKLKSGGQLIMSFPNYQSLNRHLFGRRWINWHIPYHQNFYSLKNINKLLSPNHWRIVKIKTITPNLWWELQWLNLLVNSKPGQKNFIWGGVKKTKANYFLLAAVHCLNYIFVPFYRLFDWLKLGDSYLIFVEKL